MEKNTTPRLTLPELHQVIVTARSTGSPVNEPWLTLSGLVIDIRFSFELVIEPLDLGDFTCSSHAAIYRMSMLQRSGHVNVIVLDPEGVQLAKQDIFRNRGPVNSTFVATFDVSHLYRVRPGAWAAMAQSLRRVTEGT